MGIVICQLDLSKLVLKEYKPKVILDVGPCLVKLILDGKEVIDVVDEDPLLQQQMVDAGQESVEKSVQAIYKKLEGLDKDAVSVLERTGLKRNAQDFADEFEKYYEQATDEAVENANAAVDKVWKDYVKTHKDYRNYKIKVAAKIGYSAVGIGVGVAGLLGAAATVGGLPAAIIGMVGAMRSLSTMLQTIVNNLMDAKQIIVELRADTKELADKYNDQIKAAATAKEIWMKGVEKFTTISLNSIKRCEGNLDTYVSKLKGIETEAHSVSRELNRMLIEAEKAEKLVETSKIDDLIKVLKAPFTKTFKSFEEAIDSIGELMKEVKEGQANAVDIRAAIGKLKDKIYNKVYTGVAFALDAAVLGAEVWGGNLDVKEFEQAKEIVGVIQNGLQGVHEMYENYFKKDK